ncbi:MAG: hypothetical protein K2O42_08590 [Oscillospiraceae bacterium]|nr:hypothetical protein [Oscillospiraceae bacterium]
MESNEEGTNYIGTWGVCQCFKGVDDSYVDIVCRDDFFNLIPNGKIFNCVGQDQESIILLYDNKIYRVSPKLYKVVSKPLYKIGQIISVDNHKGEVVDIHWHYKNSEPFYYLRIGGKIKTKRYMESELI